MRILSLFSILFISLNLIAQEGNEIPEGVIEVVGTATIEVSPDYAVISLRVQRAAETAEEAQAGLDEVMKQVLPYLEQRPDVENVQTQFINLIPQMDYQKNEVSNFRASQSFSFHLLNLKAYNNVLIELLGKGVNVVNGVQFKTSQEEAIHRKLVRESVLRAKEKAINMSRALDREVGEALYISDHMESNNGRPIVRAEMKMYSSLAEGSNPAISPGKISLEVEAYVRFKLK